MTVDRPLEEIKNIIGEIVTQVIPSAPVGVGGNCAQTHADLFLEKKITVFPDLKDLDALVFSLTH